MNLGQAIMLGLTVLITMQPLDLTILDHHSGTIKEWRALIDEVHSRGMYIMLDLTGST